MHTILNGMNVRCTLVCEGVMPLTDALEYDGGLITVLETNSNTDLRSIVVNTNDTRPPPVSVPVQPYAAAEVQVCNSHLCSRTIKN